MPNRVASFYSFAGKGNGSGAGGAMVNRMDGHVMVKNWQAIIA